VRTFVAHVVDRGETALPSDVVDRRRWTRARAVGAIALAALVTLSACGQPGVHPRLESIAVTGPEPTAESSPSPSVTETPAEPAPTDPQVPAAPAAAEPPCPPGEYQSDVEAALALLGTYGPIVPDGEQSPGDCEVIKAFQERMGIVPAAGTPGPTTMDVARRIANTDTTQCPVSEAPMACVDLTHQTFYITQNGSVLLGPTVTRTGMPGWATPSGTFPIANKAMREWSTPFSVWLPYWQRFYYGDGLHETTTYIHNMPLGSHGCVNLLHADAAKAYELLRVGSRVHLYGRRPGT
jgi:lipoprotein-anchoring transpeptidase ErfK/SrfK